MADTEFYETGGPGESIRDEFGIPAVNCRKLRVLRCLSGTGIMCRLTGSLRLFCGEN